jgi:hypothetical protein
MFASYFIEMCLLYCTYVKRRDIQIRTYISLENYRILQVLKKFQGMKQGSIEEKSERLFFQERNQVSLSLKSTRIITFVKKSVYIEK